MKYEEIVMKYFIAWVDNDIDALKDIFSDEIVYSQSCGAEYHGIDQILNLFINWHKVGKALGWKIKRFIIKEKTVAVEWYFKCNYKNIIDGCDGVFIIDFDDDIKIKNLKEFQSKTNHYFPYEN